jgi:hypothetical protein
VHGYAFPVSAMASASILKAVMRVGTKSEGIKKTPCLGIGTSGDLRNPDKAIVKPALFGLRAGNAASLALF